MDTQRDLNYQYGWNYTIMKYIGIWPEERKWNRPSSYVVLLPILSMLCFLSVPQTMNLPRIAHDLNLVVENLSIANITVTILLIKTVVIWMNGKSLKSLLKSIANDWATVDSKTGRETMVNIARITRILTIISFIGCQLVGAFFISNLKNELREIRPHEKNDLQTKLKKIVQKHNHIIRFAETIENNFNLMLLSQILGCIGQLCSQTFQALMSVEGENQQYVIFQIAFLIYYIIFVSLQLLLYCYVGEKLTFESTDIAETAYHCEWYNLSPKIARLLIIIMCRARALPLKLTVGKFCCCTILLYSQVVRTAVSYISVLYAAKS